MARTLQARGPDGTKLLYRISRLKFMTTVGIIIHCQDPHSGPRLQDVGCSQFTDIPSVTGNCDPLPVESSQAQTAPLYTQHLTDGGQEKLGSSLFISFQFQHEVTPPVTKASVATLRNIVFFFFFSCTVLSSTPFKVPHCKCAADISLPLNVPREPLPET